MRRNSRPYIETDKQRANRVDREIPILRTQYNELLFNFNQVKLMGDCSKEEAEIMRKKLDILDLKLTIKENILITYLKQGLK